MVYQNRTEAPASNTIVIATKDGSLNPFWADIVIPSGAENAQDYINQAINDLPADGGKIKLLEGTYTINDDILIDSNMILEGNKYSTKITIPDGFNTDINAINADTNFFIKIKNLVIDLNRGTQAAGTMNAINIGTTTSSFIEIMDCDIRETRDRGIIIGSGDNKVKNCIFINCNEEAIFSNRYENNVILNNYILGNDSDCISFNANLSDIERIIIANNVCENSPGNGIYLDDLNYSLIFNNMLFGCINGINTNDITNCLIKGNYIYDNNQDGLDLVTTNSCEITSNYIHDNGYNGISMDDSSYNSITNNYIFANAQSSGVTDGIKLIRDCNYNYFQSNNIRHDSEHRYGITIERDDCIENYIINNDLREAGVTANIRDNGAQTDIGSNKGYTPNYWRNGAGRRVTY